MKYEYSVFSQLLSTVLAQLANYRFKPGSPAIDSQEEQVLDFPFLNTLITSATPDYHPTAQNIPTSNQFSVPLLDTYVFTQVNVIVRVC